MPDSTILDSQESNRSAHRKYITSDSSAWCPHFLAWLWCSSPRGNRQQSWWASRQLRSCSTVTCRKTGQLCHLEKNACIAAIHLYTFLSLSLPRFERLLAKELLLAFLSTVTVWVDSSNRAKTMSWSSLLKIISSIFSVLRIKVWYSYLQTMKLLACETKSVLFSNIIS